MIGAKNTRYRQETYPQVSRVPLTEPVIVPGDKSDGCA
jgi:hypothetical protein